MSPVLRRAAPANPVRYKRRRPEQTTLYRLVQEHLETFLAQVEAGGMASLPQFVKDEPTPKAHAPPLVNDSECFYP